MKTKADEIILGTLGQQVDRVETLALRVLQQVLGDASCQALAALGLQPGVRVAGYLPCVPEAVSSILAASSCGAV